MTHLGSALLELAAGSRREFVMCAPFAKQRVVSEVLYAVPDGVDVRLFTRWRPDEVAAGVSDTQVLPLVRARGGVVYLLDRLHAKYYRNESRALIGSANLTATALGWGPNPNLELLIDSDPDCVEFVEQRLAAESVVATDTIAEEVDQLAKLLPMRFAPSEAVPSGSDVQVWIPSLRMPADLFTAYSSGTSALAARSAVAAAGDLAVLDLPAGLSRPQFEILVGHRLRSQALFKSIDDLLSQPRRFGEVRQLIGSLAGCGRAEADEHWQTTMRWMLEFLPKRYSHRVFRHSEVVSLVQHEIGTAR